jgi:hypothetical protein
LEWIAIGESQAVRRGANRAPGIAGAARLRFWAGAISLMKRKYP